MMKATGLTKNFLIATPSLIDDNFSKSVIYLYEYSKKGAMGVIINKPMDICLGNVFEHLGITTKDEKIFNYPVLMGGPVAQEHGLILYHKLPAKKESSSKISVSASKEMLKRIARDQGPADFIVALGYAGWQGGQLEKEIARNDWLIAPFEYDILFNTPIEKRWQAAAALVGIDINRLSSHIGHA